MLKNNEIIYQIFVRNYSKNGTFKEITKDLSRIKELGTTIIYLMPIHEIGLKNRKGEYGSPYAIKDYFSISSDLGSLEDLKELINECHKLDMKIITDMVFNHTSPDNVLLSEHEDYYFHKNGKLGNRVGDWSDIIDLNNDNIETQNYLLKVLKYWIYVGFDGFRFDVASMIPLSFFKRVKEELGYEVILIAESVDTDFYSYLLSIGDHPNKDKDLYQVFDALYNYNYYRHFISYLKNKEDLSFMVDALNKEEGELRLLCLENHDNDRIASLVSKDRLKKLLDFFSFIKGNIFIYAGQEYGNKHKPELFEKDPVDFSIFDKEINDMYISYINKKKSQKDIKYSTYKIISKDVIEVTNYYEDGNKMIKSFPLK